MVNRLLLRRFAPVRLRRGRARPDWRRKVHARERHQFGAELFAQHPRFHFLDCTLGKGRKLERPERDTNKPRNVEAEMAEYGADLAVLALADGEAEPDVRALSALDRGIDGAVMDAGNRDAFAQLVELRLRHRAMSAHAVTAQ